MQIKLMNEPRIYETGESVEHGIISGAPGKEYYFAITRINGEVTQKKFVSCGGQCRTLKEGTPLYKKLDVFVSALDI